MLWREYQIQLKESKGMDGLGSEQDEEGENDWENAGWGEDTDEDLSYLI